MDILFVTSDPALASAVKGTLESARHTVSAASDVDSLAGAWPHGTPMDLVIIDDLSAHDLLDETRRSLSRLMDGKAGDGTGKTVRPRTLLLSTPPRTPKANPDDTPQVRRQTPLPTIRKTGRAKADGQAARPAAPPSSLDGASSVPPIHADETIVKPFSDVELLSYVHALESGGAADETTLIHGDLMLDTRNRQAFYRSGKQPLALSAREYMTLETLIRANGEFLSFDELLEKVCGTGIFEQRDIMDGTLYSLTRKMRRMGFFITQRGASLPHPLTSSRRRPSVAVPLPAAADSVARKPVSKDKKRRGSGMHRPSRAFLVTCRSSVLVDDRHLSTVSPCRWSCLRWRRRTGPGSR